jgi:hypothetical protein
MSNRKYYFTSSKSDTLYNDILLPEMKFYQICAFINPHTQKHEVRESIIDGHNELVRFRTVHISKKNYSKMLKNLRENRFRLYSTYDLNSIQLPSCTDIAMARSGILNQDSDYTGYASFNSNQDFDWRDSN